MKLFYCFEKQYIKHDVLWWLKWRSIIIKKASRGLAISLLHDDTNLHEQMLPNITSSWS